MEKIPKEHKKYLGSYGPVVYDGYSGEEIGWGHKFAHQMPEGMFNEMRYTKKYGDVECLDIRAWVLVRKWITPAMAKRKYGKITKEERGPRGGFQTVTYGKTTFMSDKLDPKRKK